MVERIVRYFEEHNIIVRGLALLLGCFIDALVYNVFCVPNHIVTGGMGGIGIVVNYFTGLNPIIFLNIGIICTLFLSIFILGKKHTLHSIIGYITYAVCLNTIAFLMKDVYIVFDSFLFTVIFCAIFCGIGDGLIYRSGFDTGGMDTILTILRDKFKIPFYKFSIFLNGTVIAVGAVVFGYITAIYSIIFLVVVNKVCDAVLIGLSSKKMVFIKSNKTTQITEYINKSLDTGFTILQSTNGIGIFKRPVILCVIPTYRFYTLKSMVKDIDSKATFYSHDCYNVTGGKTNQIIPF